MREDGITPAGSLSVVIDWQKAPELRSGEVYYAGCSFFSRYPFPSKIDKKGDAWVRIARFCSPPVSHGPTRVFELSRPLLLLFTSNRAAARRSPCQMDRQVYSPWLLQAIYRPVFFDLSRIYYLHAIHPLDFSKESLTAGPALCRKNLRKALVASDLVTKVRGWQRRLHVFCAVPLRQG